MRVDVENTIRNKTRRIFPCGVFFPVRARPGMKFNMNKLRRAGIRAVCCLLCIAMAIPVLTDIAAAAGIVPDSADRYEDALDQIGVLADYAVYSEGYKNAPKPDRTITIDAASYSDHSFTDIEIYDSYMGQEGGSVYTGEEGYITWDVEVEEEGLYSIFVLYYPVEGKSSDIQRAVFIDGEIPFAEAGLWELSRIWTNEEMAVTRDTQGNDLKPGQIEAPSWSESPVADTQGYHAAPLRFYLTEGAHTVTFVSLREPAMIRSVRLYNEQEPPGYSEMPAHYDRMGYKKTVDYMDRVEAESAEYKSYPTLYPVSDHSSPAVMPYDAREIRNNMSGGEKWDMNG